MVALSVPDNGLVLIKADVAAGFLASVVSTSHQNTANDVVVENGRIQLVSNSGLIAGRSIKLDAGDQGQTLISGTLDASSSVAEGGRIEVTGGSVKVSSTANITADGKTGGGEIYMGGGWQGNSPDIRQAQTTTIEAGASISASATDHGDGGTVVIWSDINDPDSVTTVNGTIKAEGRGAGKQGGSVETSGYRVKIGDQTRISTLSDQGINGQWLIDPKDYTVAASGGDITGSVLSANLASGNVTIESASGSEDGSGDIHINDAISWSANNLTLTADRDININAVMTASGTSTLTMTANNNSSDDSDPFDPANNTPALIRTALGTIGRVRVGMKSNDSSFKGKVEFGSRTGTGFLNINGEDYTVINSLSGTPGVVDLDEGPNGDGDLAYDDPSIRYALGTDITNAGSFTNSVVGEGSTHNEFMGVFDGLGHRIHSAGNTHNGLFSAIENATVRNIALTDVHGSGAYTGVLAGHSSGNTVVHNILTTGVLTGSWKRSGGLIGTTESGQLLLDSVATNVNITSTSGNHNGGLIGRAIGGFHIVVNSHTSGSFSSGSGNSSSSANGQGGLYGSMEQGSYYILNSYSTGDINRDGRQGTVAGGMIGQVRDSASLVIDQSFASGDVYGTNHIGGLIGYIGTSVTITNTYASGNVLGWPATGVNAAGGLVGTVSNGNLLTTDNVFSYGKVIHEGNDNIGGLFGQVSSGSPNLTDTFYNSSENSSDTGSGSPSGSTAKTSSEFAAQALATTLGSANWVHDADYAYPILSNVSQLPQYIESYSGNIIDVAITSGSAGSATVIDGVSVFIDDAAIGVDTLNAALASGDVVIKSGGNTFNSEAGKIDINAGFNITQNQLTLLGSHDINVNGVVSVSGDGFIDINTDQYTKDTQKFLSTNDNVADTIAKLKTKGRFRTPIKSDDSDLAGRIDIFGVGYGAISVDGNWLNVIQDLASLNTEYGHYALGSHIGTDGVSTSTPMMSAFSGSFDGLGHSLKSLTVNVSGGRYAGLFSKAYNTLFRNLHLSNHTTTINTTVSPGYAGSLAGEAKNAIVHNLLLSGSLSSNSYFTGGLFGHGDKSYSLVDTVVSGVDVSSYGSGLDSIGGLYGRGNGIFYNSHVTGDISSSSGYMGGVIGNSRRVKISQVYTSGNVNAARNPRSGAFGGLVGMGGGKVDISNSFTTGNIYGGTNVGGLVGRFHYEGVNTLTNVYSTSNVESGIANDNAFAGGLVGAIRRHHATSYSGLDISKAFFYGTVTSQHGGVSSGGILGGVMSYAWGYPVVTNGSEINSQVAFENTFWKDQLAPNGTDSLCVVGGGQCGSRNGTIGSDTSSQDGTTSQVRALTAAQFANPSANLDSGSTSLMDLLGDSFDFENGQSTPGFKDELFSSEAQFGPPPIPLYIKTNNGSSVYGSTPSLSYVWLDANGNTFDLSSNSITSSGTISYTNAPDSTSNVGDYSYEYASGLVLSHSTQNYSVLPWNVDGIWSVTPKLLTISGTTVANKVYDRNVNATVTAIAGNLSGLLNGDTLGLTASGSFADKNVGTGKDVTISYTLADGSGLAGNYQLANETLTADITARSVTFSYTASNKSYDGTDNAQVTGSLTGAVNGDDVYLQETARFTDTNVGAGKNIQITDIALGGSDASNYSIDTQGAPLTDSAVADIIESVPVLSFASQGKLEKKVGDPVFTNALTVNGFAGSITYSSSAPEIASVNAVTGEITIHQAGEVQIQVNAVATPNSRAARKSFTLDISEPVSEPDDTVDLDDLTSVIAPKLENLVKPSPTPQPDKQPLINLRPPASGQPPVKVKPDTLPGGGASAGRKPDSGRKTDSNNAGNRKGVGNDRSVDSEGRAITDKKSETLPGKSIRSLSSKNNNESGTSDIKSGNQKAQIRNADNGSVTAKVDSSADSSSMQLIPLGKPDQVVVLSPHDVVPEGNTAQIRNLNGSRGFVSVAKLGDPDIESGNSFQILIPSRTFIHSDGKQPVEIVAQLADEEELLPWVRFDPESLSFVGQAPEGLEADIKIQLVARDAAGNTATTVFTLHINNDQ